jgi:hypothetical protein
LEASFFRDELPRVSTIQEGATLLVDSVFGGVGIGQFGLIFQEGDPTILIYHWAEFGLV